MLNISLNTFLFQTTSRLWASSSFLNKKTQLLENIRIMKIRSYQKLMYTSLSDDINHQSLLKSIPVGQIWPLIRFSGGPSAIRAHFDLNWSFFISFQGILVLSRLRRLVFQMILANDHHLWSLWSILIVFRW